LKIKIEYSSDKNEGYEFFDDVDSAIEYLQYLEENNIIDEDIEDEEDIEDNRIFALGLDKISLSKSFFNIKDDLDFYTNNGFIITYEGKTGYTLEKNRFK